MFRTLRLSLRFLVPLLLAMTALAYVSVPLVDSLTLRWFVRDLDLRSAFLSHAIEESIGEYLASGAGRRAHLCARPVRPAGPADPRDARLSIGNRLQRAAARSGRIGLRHAAAAGIVARRSQRAEAG
jgi:trehalose 6-phosphate synthase